MSRLVQIAVAVAVAAGVSYALRTAREAPSAPPTATQMSQKVEALTAQARREHPQMATTDALKQVASDQAAKTFASQDAAQRANSAADMFFGFYYLNTRGRVAYCQQRGVDLAPFVAAFDQVHGDELARARAIYARRGSQPETVLTTLMPAFASFVEQDMKDVTSGAKAPLDAACGLFNDNARTLAEAIALPAHVRQALMAPG